MALQAEAVLTFQEGAACGGKKLRDGLSAVLQVKNTLWLANDECVSVERLTFQGKEAGKFVFGAHQSFALKDYLKLPAPPEDDENFEEADIEGFDYAAGYLWVVGSHSLKRKKAEPGESAAKNIKCLAEISSDGNRFLLARLPLVPHNGTLAPASKAKQKDGEELTAACLRGDTKGDELLEALREDEHLAPFFAIPGKDNGFDIEGLAVTEDRVFIGLRGPVLRGWAVILELRVEAGKKHEDRLKLKSFKGDDGKQKYRKHFLQLNGLGVRDLVVDGDDLLILAGPTMDLDGPVTLFRWHHGTQTTEAGVIFQDKESLTIAGEIAYGQGNDHAEGITLFSSPDVKGPALLVVYDSAATERFVGTDSVTANIIALE
jgi:hypothetical protein